MLIYRCTKRCLNPQVLFRVWWCLFTGASIVHPWRIIDKWSVPTHKKKYQSNPKKIKINQRYITAQIYIPKIKSIQTIQNRFFSSQHHRSTLALTWWTSPQPSNRLPPTHHSPGELGPLVAGRWQVPRADQRCRTVNWYSPEGGKWFGVWPPASTPYTGQNFWCTGPVQSAPTGHQSLASGRYQILTVHLTCGSQWRHAMSHPFMYIYMTSGLLHSLVDASMTPNAFIISIFAFKGSTVFLAVLKVYGQWGG